MYGMSARTESRNGDYTGMIESPTFYLDSDVQGIVSEEHAKRIIEHWLTDAGLTVLGVTAVVIEDSSITTRPEEARCAPPND